MTFPKVALIEQLWMYFLDIEQDIKSPNVTIREASDSWCHLVDRSAKDHPDRQT